MGYKILGDIESPAVFRSQYLNPASLTLQEFTALPWSSDDAVSFRPPKKQRRALDELAEKDVKAKFSATPRTKADLDAAFGVNGWKDMPRLAILQEHNGKWRGIDDGKKSRGDQLFWATRRVHTANLGFVPAVAGHYLRRGHRLQEISALLNCRLLFGGGTDGESSAYC